MRSTPAQAIHASPAVVIRAHDIRGVLFGIGGLLRNLTMTDGGLALPADFSLDTAPVYPIRGHQLGYRNAANSYDAWDLAQYESYIRDLAVFGCNSIELIPAQNPDEPSTDLMPVKPWDMNIQLTSLLDRYGLDTWLWTPIENVDISQPEVADAVLDRCEKLFASCQRIDHVLVPGGDPGDTPTEILMPYLQRLDSVLRACHPNASIWVSPQGFDSEEIEFFFDYLQTERPKWLGGIAYGPWIRATLEETRERVPKEYPIRNYPDICHTVRCQFPVRDWDQAFALTLSREPINPRPLAFTHIHNQQAPFTCGVITYSDGVNDDVNKAVWSALSWDPGADVRDSLQQYARYCIDADCADEIVEGWYAFERNWVGKARENQKIHQTLAIWKNLEKKAPPKVKANWRFQQGLLRAHYDAYTALRARHEYEAERNAIAALARHDGVNTAITEARKAIAQPFEHPEAVGLQNEIQQLGKALYESIRMQLDVDRYGASGRERGAVLEFLNEPLNNRQWLEIRLQEIEDAGSVETQRKLIQEIVSYECPVPGALYDNLGTPGSHPHLVFDKTWEEDPGYLRSPQSEYRRMENARLSWGTQAQTLYGHPLRLRYDNLDRTKQYSIRVRYAGRFRATMRLDADGYPVHAPIGPEGERMLEPEETATFPVPREATKDGSVEFTWSLIDGRGCQVAEVWLMPS